MNEGDLNYWFARCFVDALIRAGVTRFSASPGSRSTPVVLAALSDSRATVKMHVDERVASFYALGQIRMTGTPSALICTSGTAGAHYLPAVVESSRSALPLLILSADRPWELQGVGANQTVDQVKLFGDHVRAYFEAGLPDNSPGLRDAYSRIAVRAASACRFPSPGPVHVNLPFRKPLEPSDVSLFDAPVETAPLRIVRPVAVPSRADLLEVAEAVSSCRRGWILCGPSTWGGAEASVRDAVSALAKATGFPVLAEVTSNLLTAADGARVDAHVAGCAVNNDLLPDCILELGGSITGGAYESLISSHPELLRVVFAADQFNDPFHSAAAVVHGDVASSVRLMSELLSARGVHPDGNWKGFFAKRQATIRRAVSSFLAQAAFCEGHICKEVSDALPSEATLVLGNSLAVRDMDLFSSFHSNVPKVLHQRGASGIDGLIAGAAGASSEADGPLVLLIGDMSARHDIGGLCAFGDCRHPVVVVVIQNNGGRIFEQLSLGRGAVPGALVEKGFVLPDSGSFKDAAAFFRVAYECVCNSPELREAMNRGMSAAGVTLIEAVVAEPDSRSWRARLQGLLTEIS